MCSVVVVVVWGVGGLGVNIGGRDIEMEADETR